jgi:cellulose synthase/poly-beta-1,6-N-acetylglucosamine synthase-like glycosyltransferase
MMTFISFSLVTLAALLAFPVVILLVEVVAAITLPQQDCTVAPCKDSGRRVAVVVPAHNESINLLPTLADIKAQLRAGDRLLVVAHNCADDTAAVAAEADAEVVVRNDPVRIGKGYALDWGLRHLGMEPPDIVIIVDADCRLADSAIDRLAATCAVAHRPVQALDLLTAPDESPINFRVDEFAWRLKNWVRPLGLRALGLPCQLMGTGMAFPWDVICSTDLASGLIVEDLKLGLDLALTGNSPIFCPSARVTSHFPFSAEGVQSQRLRWEQGHIGMILSTAPRLILPAIVQANVDLLALAFDVMVPPLSLLGMLVMGMWVVAGVAILLGISSVAMFVSSASLVGFTGAVFISWLKYGRDILPPGSILSIFSYVFGKLPLYRKILLRKSGPQWIRTDRRKL